MPPPVGKIWVCAQCGAPLASSHWDDCNGHPGMVQIDNALVAVWPSVVQERKD